MSSPTVAEIIAWRVKVAAKYRDQLGEDLTWNEASDFEQGEDAATSADVALHYVAAILDQKGPTAARALQGTSRPGYNVTTAVFVEADSRGLTGRFPHLLLGAQQWLPFQSHLVVEEPNWRGDVARYGSVFRLGGEVDEVRAFLADADPNVTAWTADTFHAPDILASAWQASDTIARLCAVATARHLPLWTTG